MRILAALGAWLGLLAVAAGAFGAHALRGRLDPQHLQTFETAVRYQLVHAVALVAIGLSSPGAAAGAARTAGVAFVAGTLAFSGSLYALALGAPRWIGVITPLGGLFFLGGWLALAIGLSRPSRPA